MTAAESWELAELEHHWGDAYRIGVQDGAWWARRRDGRGGLLTAPDAEALLGAVRADYWRERVRRDVE